MTRTELNGLNRMTELNPLAFMWLVVRISVCMLITSEGKDSVVSLKSLAHKSYSARSRHLLNMASSSLYIRIEYREAALLLAICYDFLEI